MKIQTESNVFDRRGALALLSAIATTSVAFGQEKAVETPSTPRAAVLVVLTRHGEKSTDDAQNPSLSAAGIHRAQSLAVLLANAGVTHLFSSEYRRTQDMLQPLAERLGLTTQARPAAKVDDLVRELRELAPGSIALVAGHSNTVPKLAAALGVKLARLESTANGEVLPDSEYGRVVLLALPLCSDARTTAFELHVGE